MLFSKWRCRKELLPQPLKTDCWSTADINKNDNKIGSKEKKKERKALTVEKLQHLRTHFIKKQGGR